MRLKQAHVSEAQNVYPEDKSLTKIIRSAKKQMVSLTVFVPAAETANLKISKKPTPTRVSRMLATLWSDDWIKAIKKAPSSKTPLKKKLGTHTSFYRERQ
jgi:acyl carrier protein phosphodiesterase